MITTVTPNPSIDWTLDVPTLVRGAVHRSSGQHQEPSGKGVNVSRALTVNGVDSLAVLPVGGAEGAELLALLDGEQVPHRGVPVAGAVRVNVSLTEADGTATKINAAGPVLTDDEVRRVLAAAAAAAEGADWVLGSGSLPVGAGDDFYRRLGAAVQGRAARFALDSSGPAFLAGLGAGPAVVKPNAQELADAVGRGLVTVGDAVRAAHEVRSLGAVTVVVSLGRDGALLVDTVGALHAHAAVAAPTSTVGAGDALLAGYLAATSAGADRVEALRAAVGWGSAALRLPGSRVPVVGDDDLAGVVVDDDPDPARALGEPAQPAVVRPATTARAPSASRRPSAST